MSNELVIAARRRGSGHHPGRLTLGRLGASSRLARAGSGRTPTRPDPSNESGERPRGLEQRLVGVQMPALALPFAPDALVSLATLAYRRSLVVFFYAGVQQTSGEEEAADAEDADRARLWTWRERDPELELLGYMLVGVSTQSSEEQARFASDELLGYMLLSDSELHLARELGLPTTHAAGERVYEPLTLVVRGGRIVRVFYPIDPAREAVCVMDWITARG